MISGSCLCCLKCITFSVNYNNDYDEDDDFYQGIFNLYY